MSKLYLSQQLSGSNIAEDVDVRGGDVTLALPLQKTINYGNNVKVELLCRGIDNPILNMIEQVLNKTFEAASKTQHVCNRDFTVRVFLFDDKDQYVNVIKNNFNIDKNSNGYTNNNDRLDSTNICVYKNFYDSSNTNSLTEDLYFALSKEFFHNLYNVKFCDYQPGNNTGLIESVEILEKMLVWQLLKNLGYHNQELYSGLDLKLGANTIKDEQLSLKDIVCYHESMPAVNSYYAAINFVLEKHPEEIVNILDYNYLKSFDESVVSNLEENQKTLDDLSTVVNNISQSVEFPYWIADKLHCSNTDPKEILMGMKDIAKQMNDFLKSYGIDVEEVVGDSLQVEEVAEASNYYEEMNDCYGKYSEW